jgi:hypothetical protein
MRRVISVAGLAVLLEAEDPAHWSVLDASFGSCPTAAADEGVLRLRFVDGSLPVPERPADVVLSEVDLWYTDGGAVTRHHDGIVVGRAGDDILATGPASGQASARAFRGAAQHVIADALADHGRFALHGAVVVDRGGAILLLGDAGSGTPTLIESARRLGWSVAADGIAWIAAADDGALTVAGLPTPRHAPPEVTDVGPVSAERIADDVADRVRGILLVRHGTAAATLVPFPTGPRLLTMIMRCFPLKGSPTRVRQFFPVAARLSQTPVALLVHAADPSARDAATLLRDAADRFAAVAHQ